MEPLPRRRLSQFAVEAIKSYITEMKLNSGDRLPSERKIGEQLEISRASVREALRTLEIVGLIEVKTGSGIFFKGWQGDLTLPLGVWLPLNQETLWELFEVRLLIEPRSAALAAERATSETLEKMELCLTEFRQSVQEEDLPRMILTDTEFHKIIAKATNNKTLSYLMGTISKYLTEGWKAALRIPQRPEKTINEHQKIFLAIKNHDPLSASDAMTAHITEALIEVEKYKENQASIHNNPLV